MNQYLTNSQNSHVHEEKKPIKANNIDLRAVENIPLSYTQHILKHDAVRNGRLENMKVAQYAIDLKEGAQPFTVARYSSVPASRQLKFFKLNKQLKAIVIKPPVFELPAPVLYVLKEGGQLRFCVDCCKLNKEKPKVSYPCFCRDNCSDFLGLVKIFTNQDAYPGVLSIAYSKTDQPKTGFVMQSQTNQYIWMPFSLTTAPTSFQRGLTVVDTNYNAKLVLSISATLSYSHTLSTNNFTTSKTLLTVKACAYNSKCKGLQIVFQRSPVARTYHQTLEKWNYPRTHLVLKKSTLTYKQIATLLLGLWNIYRYFLNSFANRVSSLHDLIWKHRLNRSGFQRYKPDPFENYSLAFFPTRPGLPPNWSPVPTRYWTFVVWPQVITPVNQGGRIPTNILKFVAVLVSAGCKYFTSKGEWLEFVEVLKRLRCYLLYKDFIVHTDHATVCWLHSIQEPSDRLMRWRLRIIAYNIQVMYKRIL